MVFKPGPDPNRYRGPKNSHGRTLHYKRVASFIEREDVVLMQPGAFTGDPREFFRAIFRDPSQPLELRMAAANTIIRHERADGDEDDKLTPEQRRARIKELLAEMDAGPVIQGIPSITDEVSSELLNTSQPGDQPNSRTSNLNTVIEAEPENASSYKSLHGSVDAQGQTAFLRLREFARQRFKDGATPGQLNSELPREARRLGLGIHAAYEALELLHV